MTSEFLIVSGACIIIVTSWLAIILILKGKQGTAARVIEANGSIHVHLVASFVGWKGVPWIVWGINSVNPRLAFHRDRIVYRVFRLNSRPYSSISRIDYRRAIFTENIILEFNDSKLTFIGNTANREVAELILEFVKLKHCPLSDRSIKLIEQK